MKKYLYLILVVIMLAAGGLSACGPENAPGGQGNGKLQIVATIFPEYDWIRNILGDNPSEAEVTLLLDQQVDLHSYQPTTEDILKISTCDLFVYVGGESDEWVEDALREATNKDMVVVDLLEVIGNLAKDEEVVEGMQEGGGEEKEAEYDEHVWLSLSNASVFADRIAEALGSIDPGNADNYKNNARTYKEKLSALNAKYESTVSEASTDTLLFGDRFPFRYLVDDYGIHYYAAFAGCSAETEASFETVTFLAKKVDELSLHAVITIEGSDQKIAQTIIQNTSSKDQQILTMDSMQATTAEDVQNGTTYLSLMESNLEVLKQALN